jgi:hypothetical protein
MTALQALAILEAAVLECKKRNINTPEVREALDLLGPQTRANSNCSIRSRIMAVFFPSHAVDFFLHFHVVGLMELPRHSWAALRPWQLQL